MEGLGISLVNRDMIEILYASLRGIRLNYADTAVSQYLRFIIKWIQIDNQLFGATYDILLFPSTIPKDGKELEARPTLETAVLLLKDEGQRSFHLWFRL